MSLQLIAAHLFFFYKHNSPLARQSNYFKISLIKLPDSTYELIGPKINQNKDGAGEHTLVPHGQQAYADFPRTFEGICAYLESFAGEGIVFHHPDGRMCKIKRRDFGFKW